MRIAKNLLHTLLLFALTFLFVATSYADVDSTKQTETVTGVEILTSINKAEIYVGDLVEYTLTIIYDSTLELTPPPLGINLGAFDVKDYQPDIKSVLDDGRLKSENKFVLSTFTTGDYVIPVIPINFTLPDGSQKTMFSESVPIKVLSLLFNTDEDQEIKPLKPQYEFQRDYTWYYIIGSILLILLLIIGIIIYRRKKNAEGYVEPVDLRPAWEIAFEKLAFLKQSDYIMKSEFKSYYIELTEIIRLFYEKMYNQNYTDMTTEELLASFRELELPESLYDDTKSFLRHADLVKFAKYIPEQKRCEDDYQVIHLMIEKVRVDILKKEEAQRLVEVRKAQMQTTTKSEKESETESKSNEVSS